MKGGIPRNQKQAIWPSGTEEERKEKTPVSSSKALSKFGSLCLFYRVGIAYRKMVY